MPSTSHRPCEIIKSLRLRRRNQDGYNSQALQPRVCSVILDLVLKGSSSHNQFTQPRTLQ